MKQILVLQNQRIGDTLQSTPMLAGLREKHQPCRITLVTNRLYSALRLGELVDDVIHFDQNGLFHVFSDPGLSLTEKYDRARDFLSPLEKRRFDLVIDVPADPHMHLLASMLQDAGEIRGAVLSCTRGWSYTHPEVMLLYTIGLCREINRFNLVDLENLLAGVRPSEKRLILPPDPAAEEFAERFLMEAGVRPDTGLLVALQPGASEQRKQWGNARFARLSRLLVERMSAKVLLCGSPDEAPHSAQICAEAGVPVISATGRTDIAQLAGLIRRSSLLITNDTGTMHIAAAVRCPVIDLSTGPVHFRETGPYAEGSIVVESDLPCSPCNFNAVCHHFECKEKISPDMVLKLALFLRGGREYTTLRPEEFCGVKLHRAEFNDVGRMEYVPMFRYPLSCLQLLGFFYAHAWEVQYGLRSTSWTVDEMLDRIEALHDLRQSWPVIRDSFGLAIGAFIQVADDVRAAKEAVRPLQRATQGAGSRQRWTEAFERLQTSYQRLLFFGRTQPSVRHFTAFLELAVESQAGAEPAPAMRKIHEALSFCLEQIEFMRGQLVEAAAVLDRKYACKDAPAVRDALK